MTQPTPPWGTPGVGAPVPPTDTAADTQMLPPIVPQQIRPAGPTRADVELRVTALHYATRMVGERGTTDPDSHKATTLRIARELETYLLTGKAS